MDFTFVTPRLATGAALTSGADAAELAAAGFTHYLDVTDAGSDLVYFTTIAHAITFWNPTADDGAAKPVEWFAASLGFALPALVFPNAKVYAHCSAGVNRGPSTAYAIMRALGWTADAAEAQIRAARPQVGLAYKNDAELALRDLHYVDV